MTVALMIGGDGASGGLVSRVTKKYVSREVLGSNPIVSNLGLASSLPHSRDASSLPEKDGSRSHTKGGILM